MTYKEAWEAIYFRHCEETCDYAYMDNCQEGKCEYYMALQALNRQYYAECGSVWTKPLADRKTEPQKKEVEWVYNKRERLWYPYSNGDLLFKDEPKTQMKTQNSNLTFKTLEYCDICDHKGCEECIANALDEHCMPSQFNKQIEDECAKEYEELGLKELKELIEADRKTENSSEFPNNCEHITEDGVTCAKYPACDDCLDNPLNKVKGSERLLKGKTEPQTCSVNGRPYDCGKCEYHKCTADEPQSLEQFRVGLEYHTDTTHFGKVKGESITTNKIEDEPQTEREGE